MDTINNSFHSSDVIAYLMQVIESLPGYVYWKDKESRYMGCNSSMAKTVGLNPADIVGKLDKELPWGRWQSDDFSAIDQEVMKTGKRHLSINKMPIKNKDGNYLYLKTEKVPLRDKNNEIIGVVGIAIDITDEKMMEQQQIKQKQENIIAGMPGYVYWKNSNFEYMGCNNNVVKLSGLKDRSEIIGKTDYDFHWGEGQAASFIKDDREIMTREITKSYEHMVHKPNGGYLYLRTEKMPLYENGKVVGVLGVAVDVTHLKNTQEKLKKAEGRIDGMALLSYAIAHELRTPLSAIRMTALALKQYIPHLILGYKNSKHAENSELSEATLKGISEGFDRIIKAANSSNQIINMILTNLMTDKNELSKDEEISILDCIKISIKEYTFPLGDPGLININQVQDFNFYGDKDIIKHIFFNLFKNAFYFIVKAGKGEITLWTTQHGKYNKIYFQDTGYGILKGSLSKIFNRFYTLGTNHGAGIGLAFCKLVMKTMGGNITCKSEFGKYTQFILSFPKIKK